MSTPPQPLPPNYPSGHPTATKPPFWSRKKVGSAGVILGILLGSAASGGDGDVESPAAEAPAATAEVPAALGLTEADVAEAVKEATDDLREELKDQRREARADLKQAARAAQTAQRRAVASAVRRTRAADQRMTEAAIQAALDEAQNTQVIGSGGGGTDPRFNYCYEANAAGYGPYYRGSDTEYAWYDDRDNDGVVCET